MQRFTPRTLFSIVLLSIALMIATTFALVPSLKSKVRGWIFDQDRTILAKTSGHISKEGPLVSIFKIKQNGSLKLEVFVLDPKTQESQLSQTIDLSEVRDGYITIQGNATNLLLTDTDKDGYLDIIAPTFDEQMTPRLNVFRFNSTLSTFDRLDR